MKTVESRTIDIALLKGSKASSRVDVPESLQIIDDPEASAPEGCGMFRVLTAQDGDKRIVWNRRSFSEIREAHALFNDLVSQGLIPYRIGRDGKASSEIMKEFDANVGEVIFLPIGLVRGG